MKEDEKKLSQSDLSLDRRRIDFLLGQEMIFDELRDTHSRAIMCRSTSREEYKNRPPRFRFVSEYHASIYDFKSGLIHEGSWRDLHWKVAEAVGANEPDDSNRGL